MKYPIDVQLDTNGQYRATFRLTESQAQELKAAVRDIESGNFVTLKDLLDSLPALA